MARRPPYRRYISRWPFDHTQSRLSLETLLESGYDPASNENLELEYASAQTVELFLDTLTVKQRRVVEDLMQGFPPKELYKGYKYKSTGGIRYHKWVLRKLWKEFTNGD